MVVLAAEQNETQRQECGIAGHSDVRGLNSQYARRAAGARRAAAAQTVNAMQPVFSDVAVNQRVRRDQRKFQDE